MNGTPQANAFGLLHRPAQATAQARARVPEIQRLERRIDRLGSLEVQHRYRRPIVTTCHVDVGDLARHAHLPGALECKQTPGWDRARVCGGLGVIQGVRETRTRAPRRASRGTGSMLAFWGWREDCKDPSPHTAEPHPRQVEVAARAARGDRVVVVPRERVVVPVERR